jgi:HTH-type transcriptional regulator / antitoxin MqsA
MIVKCPVCGAGKLAQKIRDVPYIYKGVETVIRAVKGGFCTACDEIILDREQGDRFSELAGAFQKKVNATLVNPDYIVEVRKKLRLDQREAGVIFGGGANAFSRYETGKAKPPVALVKLLQVLDRHPELLAEVRQD